MDSLNGKNDDEAVRAVLRQYVPGITGTIEQVVRDFSEYICVCGI